MAISGYKSVITVINLRKLSLSWLWSIEKVATEILAIYLAIILFEM